MLVLLMDMADSPGDKIKIGALYNEYDRLMYYIAGKILNNHEDIEDAVMEAWIRIIRNLDKISEISCPKTMSYVVIIVERVAINIYKKNSSKNKREVMIENFEESPIFATSDQEMSSIEVHQILRNMPKKYSDPLILYYIQELSVEEISKLLDVSTDAVYKRIQRGRKEFERRWKND
ncbi:MAG: sigma-70 family RNA polymerase sigma factor [Eubacterium sp.]|nr:sigma-70 family RNA polymerase sigma factor [Eubacterium sp.]